MTLVVIKVLLINYNCVLVRVSQLMYVSSVVCILYPSIYCLAVVYLCCHQRCYTVIDTPLQQRPWECQCTISSNRGREIDGTPFNVVLDLMVLGEVICKILNAWVPID